MHCNYTIFVHHAEHLSVARVDIISDFNYLNKKILKMNNFFLLILG